MGFRLTVTLPVEAVEPVTAFLLPRCPSGVEVMDAETAAGTRGQEAPAEGLARVVAWPPDEALPDLVFELRGLIGELRADGLVDGPSETSLEEDLGLWQHTNQVVRIAGRFALARPWVRYEPEPGELLLALEAHDAFGDGRHPSTALCLLQLARLADTPPPLVVDRILDVGCGSGVLSLAAAALWPEARIVAVDVDATAVEVCLANVEAAGLASRIEVRRGSAADVEGAFPLVLANLTAGTLEGLVGPLAARVLPEGRVVTSGYPAGAMDKIERIFIAFELYAVAHDELEDWAALTFAH